MIHLSKKIPEVLIRKIYSSASFSNKVFLISKINYENTM